MTKIFEALENADLERYTNNYQPPVAEKPTHQDTTPIPAPVVKTRSIISNSQVMGNVEKMAANLYQNIIIMLPDRQCRIVQFQGTRLGEGTSTLIREVAKLVAINLRKKVLLLDLNITGPNQCTYFNVGAKLKLEQGTEGLKPGKGNLARVGESSLYVTRIAEEDGAQEKLYYEMGKVDPLLQELKKEFDLILIDAPAATKCAECVMSPSLVDGVVLIVEAGKTRWQAVNEVKERLRAKNSEILGVVLNKRSYPIPDFIYKRI